MITGNYHTHTVRCRHAEGSEREYIEAAIDCGLKTLGFSDHTPQPFDDGFVSNIRMGMDELDDYVDTLKALREEYADRIEIKIGLEVEYYPRYFERLMNEVRKRDIEFLILGQHFVPEEENGFYSGNVTDSEDDIELYIDTVIEALETGEFMYLAHPDLINFTGDNDVYLGHMKRLCEYARDNDVPLEINGLGFSIGRWYPRKDLFMLASSMGCRFIYGCDAHRPWQVRQPESISGLSNFLKEIGF
ncbi:MAG: histidinol-phosphatase [Lachnospiraceae bacterium]|nr:histidinol-phosphatase [Lachnospiraceae bacterium]